ncbi:MAG: EAL domain-containing protein, partial [Candidatus Limnocylindrales bacterium]
IDKTFIDGIGQRGGRAVLARAIVQLGRALDLQGVAEGIERPEQASVLRRLGCTQGQGYLYARPLPPAKLEAILARGAVDVPGRPAARALRRPASEPIPIGRSHGAA